MRAESHGFPRLDPKMLPRYHKRTEPLDALGELSSRNPSMEKIFKIARRVAAADTPLLILGETGVGKEWLARAIHEDGPRREGPFVALNCGAVPESLLESELFGHVKGAFTGAVRDRRGYFELAHHGTLFLDEIAELPVHLQVKLLRVLQDHRIQRVGGEEEIQIDVRILAATHRDLPQAMAEEVFRSDLYYRLAVVTLVLPSLRERGEDIPSLVERYLGELTNKLGRSDVRGVSAEVLDAFLRYAWPGNIRELINVLERAVLLADGEEIVLGDLPDEITGRRPAAGVAAPPEARNIFAAWLDRPLEEGRHEVLAAFERAYLVHCLGAVGGRIGEAAERAGIDPRTLYSKMKGHGLKKETFKKGRS